MQAFASGNAEAFNLLYNKYRKPLYGYIKKQLPNERVDELFQEVWEAIISSANRYQSDAKFRSYLFTIARNKLIDYWRSCKLLSSFDELVLSENNEQAQNGEATMEEQLSSKQSSIKLNNAIAALPFAQKEAFLLKSSGFSVLDISTITDVAFETAKSRLKLAYRSLRSQLEKQWSPS